MANDDAVFSLLRIWKIRAFLKGWRHQERSYIEQEYILILLLRANN